MRYPQPQCGSYTKTGQGGNTAPAIKITDEDPTDTTKCINFDATQPQDFPLASTRSLMIDWKSIDLATKVSRRLVLHG